MTEQAGLTPPLPGPASSNQKLLYPVEEKKKQGLG